MSKRQNISIPSYVKNNYVSTWGRYETAESCCGLWLWRVAHNARRWDNSKAVQFLSEGDDVAKFVFSLSHSVENQQDKPLSHPVIQGAGTKANSRLHHVWVSHARPTFHYPEVGLACETKLWQSDHIFYNANERFQLLEPMEWNFVIQGMSQAKWFAKRAVAVKYPQHVWYSS